MMKLLGWFLAWRSWRAAARKTRNGTCRGCGVCDDCRFRWLDKHKPEIPVSLVFGRSSGTPAPFLRVVRDVMERNKEVLRKLADR